MGIDAKLRSLTLVFALAVGFTATASQQAKAQSYTDRDIAGTAWDCVIDVGKNTQRVASGRPSETLSEDHLRISFNPGGLLVFGKGADGPAQRLTEDEPQDWTSGEWKQDGETVLLASNGTVESFHAQPWKDGYAEKMIELKISGGQMQGQLLSHSNSEPTAIRCQLDSGRDAVEHNSQSVSGASSVDVRFSSADSRLLTDSEMAALRDSLHWEPESAQVTRGGTAVSNLLDREGHKLGSIGVQWTKTVAPKGGPAVESFILQIENQSSCGFLAEAEFDDHKGDVVVSNLELDSLVGLHQPASGQITRVEGEAELPNPIIVLKPIAVSSTLSACTTPLKPLGH
jgi:hypothetical protein